MTAVARRDELAMPPVFITADRSSGAGQRRFLVATKIRLVLLLIASLAGVITLKSDQGVHLGAVIAAVAFVGAVVTELFLVQDRPEQSWYEGRAVAESVKTTVWRYAVGGEPFGIDALNEQEADVLLVRRLRGLVRQLAEVDVAGDRAVDEQVTPSMRALRAQPFEERKARYGAERLAEQQQWYAAKAAVNARGARTWSVVTVLVEMLGASAAIAKATTLNPGNVLTSILSGAATIAAGLAGWSQSKQHATLATSYRLAAEELGFNRTMLRYQKDESTWSTFVRDAEEAISREHTMWRANRGLRGPVDERPVSPDTDP
jgi:hypothetical protein